MIRYQRRKYRLVNIDNGSDVILDGEGANYIPRNWDSSERQLKRSTKNFSITTILSKDLEFTGTGANFLISAYNSKGIDAKVEMYEYRYDTPNSEEYIYSVGDFDFSDYSRENNIVKVPFESGGLTALIKSKLNDKFELNRTESVTGSEIEDLRLNEFAIINRPLFLNSLLETPSSSIDFDFVFATEGGVFKTKEVAFPLDITYESDDNITSVLPSIINDNVNTGLASSCFYYQNNSQKSLSLDIDIDGLVDIEGIGSFVDELDIVINTYEGSNLTLSSSEVILSLGTLANESKKFEVSNSRNIIIDVNQSIAIVSRFRYVAVNNITVRYKSTKSTLKVSGESYENAFSRRSKFAFNKDVGSQLLGIINGDKTTYKSDFFNNSEFKLTGLTSGKYIRGFSDSKITSSLKDFFANSRAVFNMGYNIETISGKQTVVHEPLSYFFRSETKIVIPQQVNKVKRSVAKEFIFNTIKSGYKKPSGDNLYEEVNGLTEFNTSNEYTSPITRLQKDYDIESPYRADSEGKELTLRKSIDKFPTEDYRTDNTIFNLDLKDVGTNVYAERVWQDDYEQEPKSESPNNNIFSPDTLTGLRLTPFRNMQRHFWFLNGAFTKTSDESIRYSSTRGSSDLITKKVNEQEYAENGNYKINTLENAIFVSEWIEFEFPVNSDILNQVNGLTTINGVNIPNIYFKVEFINEFNKKEYGYLFNFKPNKEGKWKLLKAL